MKLKQIKKEFIIIFTVLLAVGFILGGAVVGGAVVASTKKSEPYGTRDGKTIKGEAPYEYLIEDNFEPIECGLSRELQEYTYYLCRAYYIDFDFVMGLMFTESSFNTDSISNTDDYGLMQINKCNHDQLYKELGIEDITEPYQNIRAGLYILRRLFEKYDSPEAVCMAYNMGEYGASVLWAQGIYETEYSNKVISKANEYALQRGAVVDDR